jgi:hypothetical protein
MIETRAAQKCVKGKLGELPLALSSANRADVLYL